MEMALSPPPPPKEGRKVPAIGRIVPPPPPPRAIGEDSVRETWKKMSREQVKEEQDKNNVNRRAPMEGLFYHDEKGNPRKMSFSYDLTKEDKTVDEIYNDWEVNIMKAGKGEKWDEWRKRASDWMFFDQARIFVRGGDGGAGEVAFRREAHVEFGGPFGGNGGQGGDVVFLGTEGDNTLAKVRSKLHLLGECGRRGQGKGRHAATADDIQVEVPLGTVIRDGKSGTLIGEMTFHGQRMVVATGGRGGRGNMAFRNAKETTPEYAELGEKGQERWLDMQMKLIADVGIVGVPNAGKSSLLAAVTNAKPKVADYPFTTVVPNLGVCHLPGTEFRTLVLADIPGLIDGAAQGTGLGQAFLRHIERCRVLVHMVDGSVEDPVEAFRCVQNELRQFSPELAEKPQVVLINKMDLPAVRAKFDQLRADLIIESGHSRVDALSAATTTNTLPVMQKLRAMIDKLPPVERHGGEKTEEELRRDQALKDRMARRDSNSRRAPRAHEVIQRQSDMWELVPDDRLKRLIDMTNFDNDAMEERFHRILLVSGVREALGSAGATQGDTVILQGLEFEYREDSTMMTVLAKEAGFLDYGRS